jgi:hypothetical protein
MYKRDGKISRSFEVFVSPYDVNGVCCVFVYAGRGQSQSACEPGDPHPLTSRTLLVDEVGVVIAVLLSPVLLAKALIPFFFFVVIFC